MKTTQLYATLKNGSVLALEIIKVDGNPKTFFRLTRMTDGKQAMKLTRSGHEGWKEVKEAIKIHVDEFGSYGFTRALDIK